MSPVHEHHTSSSTESAAWLDPFRLVQRWRYAFIGSAAAVVLLVAIVTVLSTPIYETRVKLLITDEQSRQVDPTSRLGQPIDKEFCQTQAEILKSRPITEQVVKRLGLDKRPGPSGPIDVVWGLVTGLREKLTSRGGADPALAEHFRFQAAVSDLGERISVYLVRNATVLDVTVADHDQRMVAKIADALGDIFVERTRELKRDDSHQANIYLTERLAETSRALVESEKALRDFEEKNQAAHLDTQIKHLMETRMLAVDDELATVAKQLAEERARLDQVTKQLKIQYAKQVTGQGQGVISQLKMQLMEKEGQMANLLLSYTKDQPEVTKVRMEIEALQRGLSAEQSAAHSGQMQAADRVTESLEVTSNDASQALKVLSSRREALTSQRAELLGRIKQLLARASQQSLLSREVEANKKLYDVLLMRQKEASLKEATTSAPARIIERPIIPRKAARPRYSVNLALGIIFGLLFGFLVVHLLEYADATLKTRAEIVQIVGVPVLATLVAKPARRTAHGDLERAVQMSPTSQMAESFKTLRASLRHVAASESHRVLIVSSAQASEGKTTVVANLAITLAQGGDRVLMIDADLRRPRLDRVFEMPGKVGVGDLGKAQLDALIHPTGQPNLWLMPAGAAINDPGTYLEGPELREALTQLRTRYDRILIDTAPVNVVSDSVAMVPRADGILFVVCAEEVTRSSLETALERLRNVRANIVGMVINNLRTGEGSYGYYYYAGEDRRGAGRA